MKKNSFSDYDLTTLKPKSSVKTKVEDLNYPTFANTLNMTKSTVRSFSMSTLKEESQKENTPNFVTDQNEDSIQKKERSVNKFSSFQK